MSKNSSGRSEPDGAIALVIARNNQLPHLLRIHPDAQTDAEQYLDGLVERQEITHALSQILKKKIWTLFKLNDQGHHCHLFESFRV
jgi:hypothetical protein